MKMCAPKRKAWSSCSTFTTVPDGAATRTVASALRFRRLADTDEPIARVASACGSRDLTNLARRFKARTGLTMRVWRTQA